NWADSGVVSRAASVITQAEAPKGLPAARRARRSTALKGPRIISPVDAADAVALGDAREHGQAGHDPAQYGVGAVEMRLGGVGDEALATARIGAGKRHAHRTRPVTRGIHLIPDHEAGAAAPLPPTVPPRRRGAGPPQPAAPGSRPGGARRPRTGPPPAAGHRCPRAPRRRARRRRRVARRRTDRPPPSGTP